MRQYSINSLYATFKLIGHIVYVKRNTYLIIRHKSVKYFVFKFRSY